MSHRDLKEKIRRETKGKSPSEEIRILEGYLRDWPEFKGPYQELRKKYETRIAELRRVVDVRSAHRGSGDPFAIRKRGLASVALVGLPNSGKSRLAASLTGVDVESADYAFSTLVPNVVMMNLGGVAFEILDLPPVSEGRLSELPYASGIKEAVLNATLLGLVVDLRCDAARSLGTVGERLDEIGVTPVYDWRPASGSGASARGCILFGTYSDLADPAAVDELRALRPDASVALHPLAADGRVRVGEALCRLLGMMLVTARDPAAPEEPMLYAVPESATVRDLADRIHHDLAQRARRAKVWGDSAAFGGQEVGLDHELAEGDVVEIF